MGCLFCDIRDNAVSAVIIYDDDSSLAFLDITPCSPGHTVIISKIHSENIIDLPEAAVAPLFLTVKKITGILDKALKPQGFTIGINHGQYAGQAISHLHIHVIPRYMGDSGGSIHSVVRYDPGKSVEEVFTEVKKHI